MTDWKIRQNRDGGWAYAGRGCSWTEPTAYVLLAQTATQIDRPGFEAGIEISAHHAAPGRRMESPARRRGKHVGNGCRRTVAGGGNRRGVNETCPGVARRPRRRGIHTAVPVSTVDPRNSRRRLRRVALVSGRGGLGYSHIDLILAFEHALARREDKRLRERVNLAREFLVDHMCADGGWNHGAAHALGRDAIPIRRRPAWVSPRCDRFRERSSRTLSEKPNRPLAGTSPHATPRKALPGCASDFERTVNLLLRGPISHLRRSRGRHWMPL